MTDGLAVSPEHLRAALPGGGAAVALLQRHEACAPAQRQPLKGERFGAFMADVVRDVQAVAQRAVPTVTQAQAAEAMRAAVISGRLGEDLQAGAKARMVYALYGVRQAAQAQEGLSAMLAATPGYQSLPPEQAWRMCLDRSAWGDGRHAGTRFENEPGYMGAMYNGLTCMLRAHQEGRGLDAAMLEHLHDAATQGVFQMSVATNPIGDFQLELAAERTGPVNAASSPSSPSEDRTVLQPGFKAYDIAVFGLQAGNNVTRAGLRDFFANQALHPRDERCELFVLGARGHSTRLKSHSEWDGHSHLKVMSPPMSSAKNMAKADVIIDRYRRDLQRASTEDAKLVAIASCVQRLEQAHLFTDGNARTTGFLVLNKLLLESGLRPAMTADPNRFDAFSIKELVQEIKLGQQTFADHCRPPQ